MEPFAGREIPQLLWGFNTGIFILWVYNINTEFQPYLERGEADKRFKWVEGNEQQVFVASYSLKHVGRGKQRVTNGPSAVPLKKKNN